MFTLFGPYELRSRIDGVARTAQAARPTGTSRASSVRMAEVFRAVDQRSGAVCALKRIHPHLAADEELLTMFEDEARIASALAHPNIAKVLDYGMIEGTPFIAYELVDGVDLQFVLENASLASEPPPLAFLLHVFSRVADGLAHAHDHGVLHRDVTPHNVMIARSGDVKLIDFGIARAKGAMSRTGDGVLKGKLGYMSPEQLRGGTGDPIDHRTDVFSLGICMWELLTLKRLFSAPNEILVLDMVKRHVPEPPSAHRLGNDARKPEKNLAELDRIVLKALAKNHDERYRSARQVTKDLEVFVQVSGAIATREDIARTMRQTLGQTLDQTLDQSRPGNAERSTGSSIMELQETRMSDDNKSGSDLDIFEGLGKKSSARTSAAPPPPPGSANVPSAPSVPAAFDTKRTLMGIPGPAQPPSQGNLPSLTGSAGSSADARSSGSALQSSSPAAAPPPVPSGRVSAPPPLPSGAPASGSMRAATLSSPPPAPSKPPPPPGRGSLPNLGSQPPPAVSATSPGQATMPSMQQPPQAVQTLQGIAAAPGPSSKVPPPMSTRPAPAAAQSSNPANGKLDMDWDDDDEATHVFDKDKEGKDSEPTIAGPESRRAEHASMDDILSSPRPQMPAAGTPPPPAPAPSTLSGAFGALGQPRETVNGSSGPSSGGFRSGPPASQSLRSAPPPPPGSMAAAMPPSMRPQNASTSTAPIPPPPPPGQTTTAPMHMPPIQQHVQQQHHSQPPMPIMQPPMPMPMQQHHSQPPMGQMAGAQPQVQQPPMPQMPPVTRAMEATSIVPRQPSGSAGLWIALLVGIVAAVGIAVFFLMPRTGTLVVNVADTKGGAVNKLEVYVDGKKACETAPCIVRDAATGVHEVKVVAQGYDVPAARAITVDSRKDSPTEFILSASHATVGGTGLKVSGNPLQTGVHLSVDGKDVGPLPQELHDLTAGSHTVKVSGSERYASFEKTVDVKQDEVLDLGTVALKVLKGKATIQLATPGAKVYLVNGTNRKEVPQFPIAIDFDPNEKWNLEAKMFGMDDYAQPISFDDGQAEKTIVVSLSPKGTSVAAVPAPTAVRAPTFTPPPATAVAPPPPPPATAADPPVAKDPPTAKTAAAPAAAAGGDCFLNINSRPASTVVLDGKPLGPTPRVKVPVTAGTHTVLFVNAEESLKKSVSVTIAAGETKAVSAKLRD